MLNAKKILPWLLALSSTVVVAEPVDIEPETRNLWQVGLTALYLRPALGGNGLGYTSYGNYAGADNSQVITTHNNANHMYNVVPKWNVGFRADFGYNINDEMDVDLNWSRLHEHVGTTLPHDSLFSGSLDGFYASQVGLSSRWDAVRLELGKFITVDTHKSVRLHAGLDYARIKNTFTTHPKLFIDSDAYLNTKDTLSYSGIGPRIGADFKYGFDNGFGVYLKTAGSLLVGTAQQSVNGLRDYTNTIYGLIEFGVPNYQSSNTSVVVPALEGKLGITYEYAFKQGNLDVDLGYLWLNYIDAVNSYTGIGVVGSAYGIPANSNFSLNGLYFGLNWSF